MKNPLSLNFGPKKVSSEIYTNSGSTSISN